MVEPMTKSQMRRYLEDKRTYSKKRLIAILTVDIIISILSITLLILYEYVLVAVVAACIYCGLIAYSIIKLKKWIKFSDPYHAASVVLAYLCVGFGMLCYLLVYDVISLYYYMLAMGVASLGVMYLSFRYVKHRFDRRKSPGRMVPGSAVLGSGLVTLFSVTLIRDPFFTSLGFRIAVAVVWIVAGSYLLADDYFNYRLSKKIDARYY